MLEFELLNGETLKLHHTQILALESVRRDQTFIGSKNHFGWVVKGGLPYHEERIKKIEPKVKTE